MLHHCWHDVTAKYQGDRPNKTVDSPTQEGRVCCYCGEIRPEPLPPLPPKRSHGAFVDDTTEWYVRDETSACPGIGIVNLNVEPHVVPMDPNLDRPT